MELLNCGSYERLKAAVHLVVGIGCAVCAGYSVACLTRRRNPHLFVNAVVYAAGTVWESNHVRHHWRAIGRHDEVAHHRRRA